MPKKFKNLKTLLLPLTLLIMLFSRPNEKKVTWGEMKIVVIILIVWILLITIKIGFYNYAVFK